jgi:predicted DNA-binding transcriptional regulator YafY
MGHAQSKREKIEQTELLLEFAFEGVSIFEIAEHVDCDPSTAHRYLKEIEQRRKLIEVVRGRYRLDPSESLTNVSLYPSEALSIYLAMRRFIRQTSKAPRFMITAVQKIARTLRKADLQEVLVASSLQLREVTPASGEHKDVWETLLRGWLENIVVRIHYLKARAHETDEHEIEPYLFEPMIFGHGTYLIAWSRLRGELRTFKLDRIQRATLTLAHFEKPKMDVNELLKHAWGIWYGAEPTKVELIFVPEVARRVMETVWHPTEQKHLRSDGSLYWSVEVVGTLEVLSWIRSWSHEVEVIAPKSLRDEVVKDLHKALQQYNME